jgi:hypothetical protein
LFSKKIKLIVGVGFVLATTLWVIRNNVIRPASDEQPPMHSTSTEATSGTPKKRAPTVAAPPQALTPLTRLPSETGLKLSQIERAWAAQDGLTALRELQNADLSDPINAGFLRMIRGTCSTAQKHSLISLDTLRGSATIENAKAGQLYFKQYCGGSSILAKEIEALLAPVDAKLKSLGLAAIARGETKVEIGEPQYLKDLYKLQEASKTSIDAADAVINQLLIRKDPDFVRNVAAQLATATEGQGSLAAWNAILPPNAKAAEREQIFMIAGELLVCPVVSACRSNAVFTMYECSIGGSGRCQHGEDLLSYRRRTTSPMLYQAAEQIAAAMQARRYR